MEEYDKDMWEHVHTTMQNCTPHRLHACIDTGERLDREEICLAIVQICASRNRGHPH